MVTKGTVREIRPVAGTVGAAGLDVDKILGKGTAETAAGGGGGVVVDAGAGPILTDIPIHDRAVAFVGSVAPVGGWERHERLRPGKPIFREAQYSRERTGICLNVN